MVRLDPVILLQIYRGKKAVTFEMNFNLSMLGFNMMVMSYAI